MIDAPEAQAAVEYRCKDARIRMYFVEIQQIVKFIDENFDRFEGLICCIDDMSGTQYFADVQYLEDERKQYGYEINQ